MEISPISSVRIAPMIRPRLADLGLTDVYEIENSTRTGDETYSPTGANAATGFEDDDDTYEEGGDENQDDSSDDETEVPLKVRALPSGPINYFA
jgi:hypothetical protein